MLWRGRNDREEDLERELQSHLELVSDEQEKNGLTAEEARYAARRVLGNTTLVKEEVREIWGWTRLGILAQDVLKAARTLRKSPGFAVTAFLTLAIGIGASTAVFTVVDSVILKPLAYRDSGDLDAIAGVIATNEERDQVFASLPIATATPAAFLPAPLALGATASASEAPASTLGHARSKTDHSGLDAIFTQLANGENPLACDEFFNP